MLITNMPKFESGTLVQINNDKVVTSKIQPMPTNSLYLTGDLEYNHHVRYVTIVDLEGNYIQRAEIIRLVPGVHISNGHNVIIAAKLEKPLKGDYVVVDLAPETFWGSLMKYATAEFPNNAEDVWNLEWRQLN